MRYSPLEVLTSNTTQEEFDRKEKEDREYEISLLVHFLRIDYENRSEYRMNE